MSISSFHGGLEWLQPLSHANSNQFDLGTTMSAMQTAGSQLNQRNINEFFNPRKSELPLSERVALVSSVGEEVTKAEELEKLLERKDLFRCYDGFEPSGRMHIAQGIMKSINVNKIT